MPSPVGHALAGIAVAWAADLFPGNRAWRAVPERARWYARAGGGLTLACAALAFAPDLDLLIGFHRSITHSFVSVVVVAAVAGVLAAKARLPVTRIACMCAGAWATHMLLDWLAVDPSTPRGIQALWPFDDRWFMSGLGSLPGDRTSPALQWAEHQDEPHGSRQGAGRDAAARARALVSTCKSPGRIFFRAAPTPPFGGVRDTGDTSDRQSRRAEPRGWQGRRQGR